MLPSCLPQHRQVRPTRLQMHIRDRITTHLVKQLLVSDVSCQWQRNWHMQTHRGRCHFCPSLLATVQDEAMATHASTNHQRAPDWWEDRPFSDIPVDRLHVCVACPFKALELAPWPVIEFVHRCETLQKSAQLPGIHFVHQQVRERALLAWPVCKHRTVLCSV